MVHVNHAPSHDSDEPFEGLLVAYERAGLYALSDGRSLLVLVGGERLPEIRNPILTE